MYFLRTEILWETGKTHMGRRTYIHTRVSSHPMWDKQKPLQKKKVLYVPFRFTFPYDPSFLLPTPLVSYWREQRSEAGGYNTIQINNRLLCQWAEVAATVRAWTHQLDLLPLLKEGEFRYYHTDRLKDLYPYWSSWWSSCSSSSSLSCIRINNANWVGREERSDPEKEGEEPME